MTKKKYKNRHKKREKREKRATSDQKTGKTLTGVIAVTPSGFGFVAPDEGEGPDVFIPPKYLGAVMHGDRVEVELLKERRPLDDRKGPAGKVVKIIERGRDSLVGELIGDGFARPLNRRFTEDLKLKGGVKDGNPGDWVELELRHSDSPSRGRHPKHEAKVTNVLGEAGIPENDLQAVIHEYALPEPYSDELEAKAAKLSSADAEREDMTDLFCVTIDPPDAKDYDDAISLKASAEDPGLVELGVHIADVAAWIQPDSSWDREARGRGFTSYLPGKTLPMLPRSLTKAISLSPERTSPAHTVILTVAKETGKIVRTRRAHTNVVIGARLNFDQVDEFIAKRIPKDWSDHLAATIGELVALTQTMRRRRKSDENFLELATSEVRILCDEDNQTILGLRREVQTEADRLVEECMLAANSAVAGEMIERRIPGLFRIHPEPLPEKLEDFAAFMAGTFDIVPGDLSTAAACNHFLDSLPDDHKKPVIVNAFLRALSRASYFEEPAFHFGLGKGRYSHFTSPIRRYPDLAIHQQLWVDQFGGGARSKKRLGKFAADCSRKEEVNDEAYYAANDRLKLHYLRRRLEGGEFDFHEGVITKITSAGLVVDVPELGVFGFVEREGLGSDFRKSGERMISLRDHKEHKCGDFIYLRLERVDFIRGSAIFRPVQ